MVQRLLGLRGWRALATASAMLVTSFSQSVAVQRASAQWTPAMVLATASGGGGPDTSPELAFSQGGTPVVWWGSDRWSQAPDGSWSRCRSGGVPLALFGRDRIVLGAQRHRAFRIAFGRTSSCEVTRARTLVASKHLSGTVLAADRRGDIAFAWTEYLGWRRGAHASVIVRRAGGDFGRPLVLGRIGGDTPSVAVGPRGDILVAWRGYGSHAVLMRYRAAGARLFGPVQHFRVLMDYQRIVTLVTRDGGAFVAAVGADGPSEGGHASAYELHAAVKPPRDNRFRAAQTLESDLPGVLPPIIPDRWAYPRLALTADRVALAWTGWDGARLVVKESAFDGRRFAPPATFSLPGKDVLLGGLALAHDGRALVTWGVIELGSLRQWGGALRAPGVAFGPPEPLAAFDSGAGSFWPPEVAGDPSGRSALAAWTQYAPNATRQDLLIASRPLAGSAPGSRQRHELMPRTPKDVAFG